MILASSQSLHLPGERSLEGRTRCPRKGWQRASPEQQETQKEENMKKKITKATHMRTKKTAEQEQKAWQERQVREARRWVKKHKIADWLEDAEDFLRRMDDFPVDLSEGVQEVEKALAEAKANPTDKAKLKELAEQLFWLGEEMRDNLSAEPVDASSLADGFERFGVA